MLFAIQRGFDMWLWLSGCSLFLSSETSPTPTSTETIRQGHPPQIISFSANVDEMSAGDTLVITAVLTDPDNDVKRGTLSDTAGALYGAFVPTGNGVYSIELDWDDVNNASPLNGKNGRIERRLRGTFFDANGWPAIDTLTLDFVCPDNPNAFLCSGKCVSTPVDGCNPSTGTTVRHSDTGTTQNTTYSTTTSTSTGTTSTGTSATSTGTTGDTASTTATGPLIGTYAGTCTFNLSATIPNFLVHHDLVFDIAEPVPFTLEASGNLEVRVEYSGTTGPYTTQSHTSTGVRNGNSFELSGFSFGAFDLLGIVQPGSLVVEYTSEPLVNAPSQTVPCTLTEVP